LLVAFWDGFTEECKKEAVKRIRTIIEKRKTILKE
jgi:hypothetical protein